MTPGDTARLAFRELALHDLDFVAEMLADAEVMRYYAKRYSRAEAQEWIERQRGRYVRDGHALWLVLEKATGVPIGQVGLVLQTVDEAPLPEVGYLVHRPYWRRGFATEAARATRDHAFQALGQPRVISLIRPENTPSQGVARALGMTPGAHTTHGGFDSVVWSRPRPA